MRKCITGHVGDAAFGQVLKLIDAVPPRATLFALRGPSEKVIHFSEEKVLLLELPAPEPKAGGAEAAEGVESSRSRLRKALQEICSWTGAPFEYREGHPAPALESHERTVKLVGTLAQLEPALKGATAADEPEKPRAGAAAMADRLARAEEALKLTPQAFSKQLLARELAQIWKDAGSGRRAASCLRDVAKHFAEWGAEENACETLEQALELCPADLGAAEELIALSQSAGRQKQAERAAEHVCAAFEKLKLHERVVEVYRMIERAPESPSLRRFGAEALIKTGDIVQGLREMTATATFLESRGDSEGAIRIYERIVEVDPSNADARERVRKVRRHQIVSGRARRSATLIAASALFILWFAWDVSSASAFERLKAEGLSREPRAAVDLVREGAGRFPGTRLAGRLAGLEGEIYRQSYDLDKTTLLTALIALKSGDLGTAAKLFDQVATKTLIVPFRERARAGREEIEKRRARTDGLVEQAARLVKARELPKAFGVYRELLLGSQDDVLSASYSVPALIETVPQGVSIRIDGQDLGRAPRWVFLPSDPNCRLVLGSPGFETAELVGPLASMLEKNDSRLRVALTPEPIFKTHANGGELAAADAQMIVTVGADGIIRALEGRGTRRWETPLDAGARCAGAPLAIGQALMLGTEQGQVLAFSTASGKPAWIARPGPKGGAVKIGPVFAGQAIVSCGSGALLLNPQTGLICRKIRISPRSPIRFQAAAGSLGIFALENGDVLGADLETGASAFTSEGLLADASWAQVSGEILLAGGKGGAVRAWALPGCDIIWEASLQGDFKAASCVDAGRVVLGSSSGGIVCLDSRTGQPVWKTTVEGAVTSLFGDGSDASGAVVARVARSGNGGALAAVSVATGKVVWEVKAAAGETASVRMDRSRVAVSTPSLGVVVIKAPGS